MQMYGSIDGIPLNSALVSVGNILTPKTALAFVEGDMNVCIAIDL